MLIAQCSLLTEAVIFAKIHNSLHLIKGNDYLFNLLFLASIVIFTWWFYMFLSFSKVFYKMKKQFSFFFFQKSFTLELLFWIKNSAPLNDEVRLKSEFLFESISLTIKNNFDSFNGYSSPPNLDLSIILVHFCKFSFCFLNLSKLASSAS